LHHPTKRFTAEISGTEVIFLDTAIPKGERFKQHSILDIKTDIKPTEILCVTHMQSFKHNINKDALLRTDLMWSHGDAFT